MSETMVLIPEYTYEDFTTEVPYAFLYQQKDNKFLVATLLQKMSKKAKQVGYSGFMATWKAYVQSKKPETTILGESETMFEDQPVQLSCGVYTCTDNVKRTNEYGVDIEVISHPIMPVRRVTNIETYEEKLELAYRRGHDAWKNITVSRETLASAQKIITLARQGIAVNSENAKEVVKFLGVLESSNYDNLPRKNSVGHMGWLPDGRFLPYVEDITYDGESAEFNKIYSELRPIGDEDVWMNIAREVRSGESVPARIALAAGFAGPLVKLLNGLSFFVHFWGDKGCGKTVGLMLGASVWGNPEIGGYAKAFGGTRVSMELHSAFCCNLPIFFDELQVINDNRRSFDDLIYMLCEGVSKGRGAKEGGLQLQRRWCTCIVTTGETPIIQSNSGGGAAVRTIEVNFKGQRFFKTDERAMEIANLLKENYGHAGKKFIEAIQQPNVIEVLKTIMRKNYNQLAGEIDGKQVLSASILLTADKLADIAIFHDGKSLTPDDIKEFLVTKAESDANNRCYNFLIDWVDANPRRFDTSDSNSGESWGVIENNIAYINKTIFENILRNNGYSIKPFLNWAKAHRKIAFDDSRYSIKKTLPGGRARCIALKLYEAENAINEESNTGGEYTEVDVGDEMPF